MFEEENSIAAEVEDSHSHPSQEGESTSKMLSGTAEGDSTNNSTTREMLAKRESIAVFRLRLFFMAILVVTATVVSYLIHHVTRSGETDAAKAQYEAATDKINTSFKGIMNKMGSVSGLGVAITSEALDHEASWPFVSMRDFQQKAENALHVSGALSVEICPIVYRAEFEEWDDYVSSAKNSWIDEAVDYQKAIGVDNLETQERIEKSKITNRKIDLMHYFDAEGMPRREDVPTDVYLPVWLSSPYLKAGKVNENILQRPNMTDAVSAVMEHDKAVLGGFMMAPAGDISAQNRQTAEFATLRSISEGQEVSYLGDPISNLLLPLFSHFEESIRQVSSIMLSTIHWRSYLRDILPKNVKGVIVVLHYDCRDAEEDEEIDEHSHAHDDHHHGGFADAYTYEINGAEAIPIGSGDLHDTDFSSWERRGAFNNFHIVDGSVSGIDIDQRCIYHLDIYPSQKFFDEFRTSLPISITCSIAAVFLFTIIMFVFYNQIVEKRQKVVVKQALQSTAIISSLFPKQVRDKLMESSANNHGGIHTTLGTKNRLKGFLAGATEEQDSTVAPIADFFPNCTVFFGDLTGFTAWSSTREPDQVFTLLQTVYQAFDKLAKRRRVFKVETIGDSYMAVTGLPEPSDKHAVTMVRFAWDCQAKLNEIVKELESTLGPDTSELSMRFGLNSGPVTAGVLRGDRARFQLFGDTVNTASRMESTGKGNMIHISGTTANLLAKAGKSHWFRQREDTVTAKGKGVVQTYWMNPPHKMRDASVTSGSSSGHHVRANLDSSYVVNKSTNEERLINWMQELFVQDIRKIIHARMHKHIDIGTDDLVYRAPEGQICLDEVQKAVKMEEFHPGIAACTSPHLEIVVDDAVKGQLREFITVIASMYRNNPFHNFEHCCHVAMSVKKLIQRVTKPELTPEQFEKLQHPDSRRTDVACHIHECTYGVNSSPLARLALTFSALVHDVDHRGVSNFQMSIEEPQMAKMYRGKSIAEQNSLDLAWELLMQDNFVDLRRVLFTDEEDLVLFRRLVVNAVLATDIFDKDLNALRRDRWTEAFSSDESFDCDLRATIILEHIMQASDVSHTMQHWHVYQKWNIRLFKELYAAWKAGRLAKDPSTFWYQGEIGFFDNYVIPLALKLKECGVFGVSSDEYLNYAEQNRNEWKVKGESIVAEMLEEILMEEASPESLIASSSSGSELQT